ncbi:hypothetical protein ACFU7T_39635 [Streptomyces sp. NPDC057555]|uniref:hypothetical protein n=1 Tax=Streptomyces sp. NPDC057555 TaxID=3346166 RepID=UPI003691750A
MTLNYPDAEKVQQGTENLLSSPEASESVIAPEESTQDIPDASESIRAAIEKEYSLKFAHAELKVKAAEAGVTIPNSLLEAFDTTKLVSEDGSPNEDTITAIIGCIPKENIWANAHTPEQLGLGRHSPSPTKPSFNVNPNCY